MSIETIKRCTICKQRIGKRCNGEEYKTEETKGGYNTIIHPRIVCDGMLKGISINYKNDKLYPIVEGHGVTTYVTLKKVNMGIYMNCRECHKSYPINSKKYWGENHRHEGRCRDCSSRLK